MKSTATIHATHPNIVKRLRRTEGHLHRVITMFAEGRSCLDLAQQLYAVERAVAQAKKELIRDHVDHCLEIAISREGEDVSGVVSEFKAICRYL
jgi:DNA-binding FrmR family transcriptional regulator